MLPHPTHSTGLGTKAQCSLQGGEDMKSVWATFWQLLHSSLQLGRRSIQPCLHTPRGRMLIPSLLGSPSLVGPATPGCLALCHFSILGHCPSSKAGPGWDIVVQ